MAKEENSFTPSLLASSSIIAASSDIQKAGFSYCFSCGKSGESPALPRITSYQGIAAGDFFFASSGKERGEQFTVCLQGPVAPVSAGLVETRLSSSMAVGEEGHRVQGRGVVEAVGSKMHLAVRISFPFHI